METIFEKIKKEIDKNSLSVFLPIKKGHKKVVPVEYLPAWKIKEILDNETSKTSRKVCE